MPTRLSQLAGSNSKNPLRVHKSNSRCQLKSQVCLRISRERERTVLSRPQRPVTSSTTFKISQMMHNCKIFASVKLTQYRSNASCVKRADKHSKTLKIKGFQIALVLTTHSGKLMQNGQRLARSTSRRARIQMRNGAQTIQFCLLTCAQRLPFRVVRTDRKLHTYCYPKNEKAAFDPSFRRR